MVFALPKLPYSMDALAPVMSRETLEFHYGKHHQRYVDNLNKLVPGTEFEGKSLDEIVKAAKPGEIFNNAAQIWNHTFFWEGLVSGGSSLPNGHLKSAIEKKWGTFDAFKAEFTDAAVKLFGSGWVWLVKNGDQSLAIEKTKDADCPLAHGRRPILTIDVWEHAYYIDYRNDRAKFIGQWWSIVNWKNVEALYK